jgi:epsilon-lactone hydrolase
MTTRQQETGRWLEVQEDGTVRVPQFDLPLSAALSSEAKALLSMALRKALPITIPSAADFNTESEFKPVVDAFRKSLDEGLARPQSERLLARFPVQVASGRLGGVPVETFTPLEGVDNERVLINLHGGAFYSGAVYVARMESVPVAHMGRFRVISVDYRQGYEHKFPAASEDVAAVYAELLKEYSPGQIGIFGGSAGGILTAQATAWILDKGLPRPGAIGIFGAGTGGSGDSVYFSAIGTGRRPPEHAMTSLWSAKVGYFANIRPDDYLVNPNIAPEEFRAKFPPTLIITGTRAFDLSPALATHRALVRANVDASLHVFDGLGHCFYYDASTPESVDAYNTIIRFFRMRLSRA